MVSFISPVFNPLFVSLTASSTFQKKQPAWSPAGSFWNQKCSILTFFSLLIFSEFLCWMLPKSLSTPVILCFASSWSSARVPLSFVYPLLLTTSHPNPTFIWTTWDGGCKGLEGPVSGVQRQDPYHDDDFSFLLCTPPWEQWKYLGDMKISPLGQIKYLTSFCKESAGAGYVIADLGIAA